MSRQLPHDLAAERALLGAVLLRQDVLAEFSELWPEEFFHPAHQAVWTAFLAIDTRQAPIDEITVERELERAGKLKAVGGLAFLSGLAAGALTADNATHYADIVRELAGTRRLLVGLSELRAEALEGEHLSHLARKARALVASVERSRSDFVSSALRIAGEADERRRLSERELRYNVSFLDDYLRGILPRDLIVLGAYTGAGKTQLAQIVAQSNARQGKRVYLFALEAEPDEIERRIKYGLLSQMVSYHRIPGRERFNYPDWYRGRCTHIVSSEAEAEVERWMQESLKTLHTLYRGRDFTVEHIERHFRAIRDQADLIILDHLHYVDSDDPNENRAVKEIVKRIRDVSLAIGVPVIVVAHLRKKNRMRRQLVPEIDDFHGASDITKIATACILLSRAHDQPSENSWIANTYIQVAKSRMGGVCPLIAMQGFDFRRNTYESHYMLGRLDFRGEAVEMLSQDDYPRWAVNAENRA